MSIRSMMCTGWASEVTSIFVMTRARCALIGCTTVPGSRAILLVQIPGRDPFQNIPLAWGEPVETATQRIPFTAARVKHSGRPERLLERLLDRIQQVRVAHGFARKSDAPAFMAWTAIAVSS